MEHWCCNSSQKWYKFYSILPSRAHQAMFLCHFVCHKCTTVLVRADKGGIRVLLETLWVEWLESKWWWDSGWTDETHSVWWITQSKRYMYWGITTDVGWPCYNMSTFLQNHLNSFPPGQNGRYFTDNIFRCIFVNEKFCILIKISLNFVPKGQMNNNPALV